MSLFSKILFSGKHLEQLFGRIQIAGVYLDIKYPALRINYLIGNEETSR